MVKSLVQAQAETNWSQSKPEALLKSIAHLKALVPMDMLVPLEV